MKTIKFLAPVIAAFLLISCKPSPEKARLFNDQIIDEQVKVQEKENDLVSKISEGNPETCTQALSDFMSQVRMSTIIISALPKFDKKDDFKNATLKFFDVYKACGENEYKQVIELYKKGDDYNKDDENKANELLTAKAEKKKAAFEAFSAFQQTFANEYKYKISR